MMRDIIVIIIVVAVAAIASLALVKERLECSYADYQGKRSTTLDQGADTQ